METGTPWGQALAGPTTGNVLISAVITVVEVYSAFNRRRREGYGTPDLYMQIFADFDAANATEYTILALTDAVVQHARRLLDLYALRAYDAVQLATALVAHDMLQAAGRNL